MSKYVSGYSKEEFHEMQKQDLLNYCHVCKRWHFKPKDEVGKWPLSNCKLCDECQKNKKEGIINGTKSRKSFNQSR